MFFVTMHVKDLHSQDVKVRVPSDIKNKLSVVEVGDYYVLLCT